MTPRGSLPLASHHRPAFLHIFRFPSRRLTNNQNAG
jgi:hypothetical protein